MVTENNSLINTFIKGMNSDTSYQMTDELSYALAVNLRLLSLNGNNQHGELRSIQGLVEAQLPHVQDKNFVDQYDKVLAAINIRLYGVIIVGNNDTWDVYKFDTTDINSGLTRIFTSEERAEKEKFSVVGRYEADDNIKLYIADGKHEILILNVADDTLKSGVDKISSRPFALFDVPTMNGYVTGHLKSGMVQYSYRLYKKHLAYTDASPATVLIPVYDTVKNKGISSGKESSCGISISIPTVEEMDWCDKMLIYRIHYIENGQIPTISLIYDGDIIHDYIDVGNDGLQTISIEEYNNFTGIHIIPNVIESKNDYLFAGCIKTEASFDKDPEVRDFDARTLRFSDSTTEGLTKVKVAVYSDFSDENQVWLRLAYDQITDGYISDDVVDESFKKSELCLYTNDFDIDIANYQYVQNLEGKLGGAGTSVKYEFILESYTIDDLTDKKKIKYPEEFSIYNRSLRRDEIYRYGIIFYNDKGESSSVKWIGDIRTPSVILSEPYSKSGNNEMRANKLGIKFSLNPDKIPSKAVAYEIVRCNRKVDDIHTITLGVLSRPIKRYTAHTGTDGNTIQLKDEYPFTPTGLLSVGCWHTCKAWDSKNEGLYEKSLTVLDKSQKNELWEAMNFSIVNDTINNKKVFLFISQEVSYNKSDVYQLINGKNIKIKPLQFCNPAHETCVDSLENYDTVSPGLNLNFLVCRKRVGANKNLQYVRILSGVNSLNTWYGPTTVTSTLPLGSYRVGCSYESPNSENLINVDYWNEATKNIYSFIKYYNIQDVTDCDSYDISDVNIAQEYSWNDYSKENTNSGNTSYSRNYQNNSVSIGTSSYCNFVTGGAYGIPIGETNDSDYMQVTSGHTTIDAGGDEVIHGTGGRCLVIKTETDAENLLHSMKFKYDLNNSIFGTYICNITKPTVPYGGGSNSSKKFSTYYSTGQYNKINETSIDVYDGDCYLYPFEYVSMHKIYVPFCSDSLMSTCIVNSLLLESDINSVLSHGYTFSNNITEDGISNIQIEPSNVNGYFDQPTPMYQYNTVYSTDYMLKPMISYNPDENHNKSIDYRIRHSNLKSDDESLDSWLKFDANDYLDVDSRYGEITDLKEFKNTLYYWLKQAIGIASVNERTVMNTQDNMPLVLGEGGVLSRYDYITQKSGMRPDQYAHVTSKDILYYFDEDNKSINAIQGTQSVDLSSAKNVKNIMKNCEGVPSMFYDNTYEEVVFNVLGDESLVYNEKFQAFSSKYEIDFGGCVSYDDNIYLINPNKIGEWNVANYKPSNWTKDLNTTIRYSVNKSPLQTKVFDNQEIVTSGYKPNMVESSWITELNASEGVPEMTDREGNFRYAIPRADGASYGNRIRGKYMVCEHTMKADKDTSMSYIITKIRGSLS